MGVLSDVYGSTPRVRFLEALIDLAPIEFTASQAAQQAGAYRTSFYRIVSELEEDGFITCTSEGPDGRKYRVNETDARFKIVALGEAALRVVAASQGTSEAAALYDDALTRIVGDAPAVSVTTVSSGAPPSLGWTETRSIMVA